MDDIQRKPRNVVIDIENHLMQIDWSDGHASIYDFTYLRRACPCAACQPWKEGVGPIGQISESARRALGELRTLKDITQVGNYALQFRWTDGHDSGIYAFEYLREICPCPEHLASR